jgi:thiamine-monophosphate kinase
LIVLGQGGRFWADAFRCRENQQLDKSSSPLFSPVSQANIVYRLHEAGLLHCAMDTSDGLAPTLEELASVNGMKIEVDVSAMRRSSVTFENTVTRPERLWFGWGDWTVVAGVPEDALSSIEKAMSGLSQPWSIIGRILLGAPEVTLFDGSSKIRAQRLESERFAPDSWFTEGIAEYIRRLEAYPLP